MAEKTPQQRAEQRYNEKRRGTPSFAAVRFNDSDGMTADEKRDFIAKVIGKHSGTREQALMDAFTLLDEKSNKSLAIWARPYVVIYTKFELCN